jgi:hypothetical protein
MGITSDRVFYYHADASAVGGQLTYPEQRVLKTHGACSLAQAGGVSSTRLSDLSYDHILSAEQAQTHVSGAHRDGQGWSTLVTSVVDKVDLLGVVTADRMVARLSVEHPQVGYGPKVTVVGSHFDNLRIGGVPVEVSIDVDLFQLPSSDRYPDLPWPDEPSLLRKAVDQSQQIVGSPGLPEGLRRRYEWIGSERDRAQKGYLLCSLVDGITGQVPGQTFGHILLIPGFGTLFLGEVVVTSGGVRLTMLRAELGCSIEGTVSVAVCFSNGQPMP